MSKRIPHVQMPAKTKTFATTVTARASIGDEIEMTISTDGVDRDGDRISPDGLRSDAFMRNPVLLWAHDYRSLPIGTVTQIGRSDPDPTSGKSGILSKFRWLQNDPMADRVRNAWEQGVVRAASIGFKPLTWTENATGYDITGWELLEVSLVPVPSNPDAVRILKGLGLIDGQAEPATADVAPADESATTVVAVDQPPVVDPAIDLPPNPVPIEDMPPTETAVDPAAVTTKVGRVLSGANETALREAMSALQAALAQVEVVLAQVQQPEEPADEPVAEPADEPPMLEPEQDAPDVIDIASPPSPMEAAVDLDDPIVVDDTPTPVDAHLSTIRAALRDALTDLIATRARTAVDRLRGRIVPD